MWACAGSGQDELSLIDGIDEQPVGSDMTFAKPNVITNESVIAVFFGQRFFSAECLQDSIKLLNIRSTLSQTFQILAKLRGGYEFKHHRPPHPNLLRVQTGSDSVSLRFFRP